MEAIGSIENIFGTTANAEPAKKVDRNHLGQDDFLQLLVAQIKYQDPTQPMDNQQFVAQMAQFSMVSGISGLQSSFDGVVESFGSGQTVQAASLVNRQVLTESNFGTLTENNFLTGVLMIPEEARQVRAQIHDDRGRLVREVNFGDVQEGPRHIVWDGGTDVGSVAPSGIYRVSAQAMVNGQQVGITTRLYNQVDSVAVDRASQNISLNLVNGETIDLADVEEFK